MANGLNEEILDTIKQISNVQRKHRSIYSLPHRPQIRRMAILVGIFFFATFVNVSLKIP